MRMLLTAKFLAIFRRLAAGFWLVSLAFLPGFARAADAVNGVWSYPEGGYLALLSDSGSGSVVALQLNSALSGGEVYLGSRSGNVVSVRNVVEDATLSITVVDNRYSGQITRGSVSSAVSGQLLLAYQGGAYDGVWQREGASDRYPVLLSLSTGAVPMTVLVDVRLSGNSVGYDVSTGTISTSGSHPSFVGRSLASGQTVSLAFLGGSPATGSFSVLDTAARPAKLVEQFNVVQRIAVTP